LSSLRAERDALEAAARELCGAYRDTTTDHGSRDSAMFYAEKKLRALLSKEVPDA